MPFADPEDRNVYMREYRRRRLTARQSSHRILKSESSSDQSMTVSASVVPSWGAVRAAQISSSAGCAYCSGSGRSSAGTLCSYCSPPAKSVRSVSSPPTVVQHANFSPLAVWFLVAGVIGTIGILFWLGRGSSSDPGTVNSVPQRAWVHWMEGVKV